MKELVEALLTDPKGINLDAYNALRDVLDHMRKRKELTEREREDADLLFSSLTMTVETDGRFHFAQGWLLQRLHFRGQG